MAAITETNLSQEQDNITLCRLSDDFCKELSHSALQKLCKESADYRTGMT